MIVRHSLCRRTLAAIASTVPPFATRRWLSSTVLDGLSRPVQSYISASHDPYLNLSIEHYLLQKTSPDSTILFLYINRPSIIIGRNQNPWLEVNLALLDSSHHRPETEPPGLGAVDLVRRRSGGGTVFHDEGNINWTVICPSANFTRDKHAEMVVRALRDCGVDRARVNARHDIVLDQGDRKNDTEPNNTHSTPYEATDFDTPRPLKVSGSAYKLTRNRALHHGTCLLSSPNLNVIPDYLHSPAKPFITARGVESVSSPVGNILVDNDDFITAVQKEFSKQYLQARHVSPTKVDKEWLEDTSIRKGYDELKSPNWTYLQTPQFTLASKQEVISALDFELAVRYGTITSGTLKVESQEVALGETIQGRKLHETTSWMETLSSELDRLSHEQSQELVAWLEEMLPRVS